MVAPVMTAEGTVQHRGHQIWWGEVATEDRAPGLPLLTVHGDPGICHDCLEPLAALAGRRRVIFYDQRRCPDSRSDRCGSSIASDVECPASTHGTSVDP